MKIGVCDGINYADLRNAAFENLYPFHRHILNAMSGRKEDYDLIYAGGSPLHTIPGTDEQFSLAAFRSKLGLSYSELKFSLIFRG